MTCLLSRFAPALSPILVAAVCSVPCTAQQPSAAIKPAAAKIGNQKPDGQPAEADAGLPSFLLKVPTGEVWLGLTAEQLVDIAVQGVNPDDPVSGAKEDAKVARNLRQIASALGHTKVPVEAFFLGKWPITNKEYKVFVEKTGHRFPFHWWRNGRKDDYEKRLEQINQQFPKMGIRSALFYWNQNWKEQKLPYALKDENGKSIEDKPVTWISYRDATAFAGWLGMRLPTERELTRAAKGDADIAWHWGWRKDGPGDKLTSKALELVMLKNMRDWSLKRVGEVQFLAGPFGHLDMTGQVWVFTSDLNFEPLCGRKDFEAAMKELQKLKLGRLLQDPSVHKPGMAVLKGGSYMSGGDPLQLHADSRVPIETTDVVESVGLRLAKSLRPGYDMLYSLIRSDYKQDFVPGQELDLTVQIGMERYEFGADGFPTDYQAVSFAPVNWITNSKTATLKSVVDQSQVRPVLIGTMATTVPLLTPALEPGIYSVCYRDKGMPRELVDAMKLGFKEVQAALKLKAKGKEEPPKEEEGAPQKPDTWRPVLARFGLTEKDLEPKDALDKIKFIRIGGTGGVAGAEVSTEANLLVFFDNAGAVKGTLPLRFDSLAVASSLEPTLEVGETKVKDDLKLQVKLRLGVQLEERTRNRLCDFPATFVLDAPPVSAEKAWRLPPAPK